MAYIRSGLSTEENLRFIIDWDSLVVGSKFSVFALFYLYLRAIFQVQASGGAYIRRGDLTEGVLRYRFGGLIFGGAYFRNFTVCYSRLVAKSASFLAAKKDQSLVLTSSSFFVSIFLTN